MISKTISVEREFRIKGKNANVFIKKIQPKIEEIREKYNLEKIIMKKEVGIDCGEVVIPFSNPKKIKKSLKLMHKLLKNFSAELTTDTYTPKSINKFFTTTLYPHSKAFAGTNSLHIHINAENTDEMINLYKNLNTISPKILAISDNGQRAELLIEIYSKMCEELWIPQDMSSIKEYKKIELKVLEKINKYLKQNPSIAKRLLSLYPQYFYKNKLIKISPDKIFHLARIRPDLEGVGSVEFRAIDGQKNWKKDLLFIYITLGNAHIKQNFDPEKIKYELLEIKNKGVCSYINKQKKEILDIISNGVYNTWGMMDKKIRNEIDGIIDRIRYG